MRIMAFDPGGTTGVALFTDNQIRTDQVKSLSEVWELLEQVEPDYVVFERFAYQRRDKVVLTPVEVIGVIKLWCFYNVTDYKIQTPSQAKNFWTDEKLKKIGLWETGKGHAMDALRHLLYYMTVHQGDETWVRMLHD